MRKIDGCVIVIREKFGALDRSDEAIAILRDRLWPQTVKQHADKISKKNYVIHENNV